MSYLRKFLNILFDLIYCPSPSCEKKPLSKTELMDFIIMIITLTILAWLLKQAV